MPTPKFPIPNEFQSSLSYIDPQDNRSDEEILSALSEHTPVGQSEKNVWAFWHSGIQAMPDWCQTNVINWVRLLGPSWTVRVLDSIPGSPNNALEWVSAD